MNEKEITDLSTEIITDIYHKKFDSFLDYADEDIIWIGPVEKLLFQGKKSLQASVNSAPIGGLVSLSNIYTTSKKLSSKSYITFHLYKVYSHDPSGLMHEVNQRIQFTWVIKDDQPYIVMAYISNATKYHNVGDDHSIMAFDLVPPQIFMQQLDDGYRIQVTGLDKASYFLLPGTVTYVESIDNGLHSCIHVLDRQIECNEKISTLVKRYPQYLFQIHESYLVNPGYVAKIERFNLQIVNGPTLPIPERKYTATKRKLCEFFAVK